MSEMSTEAAIETHLLDYVEAAILHSLRTQYCDHIEIFPSFLPVEIDVIQEAIDNLKRAGLVEELSGHPGSFKAVEQPPAAADDRQEKLRDSIIQALCEKIQDVGDMIEGDQPLLGYALFSASKETEEEQYGFYIRRTELRRAECLMQHNMELARKAFEKSKAAKIKTGTLDCEPVTTGLMVMGMQIIADSSGKLGDQAVLELETIAATLHILSDERYFVIAGLGIDGAVSRLAFGPVPDEVIDAAEKADVEIGAAVSSFLEANPPPWFAEEQPGPTGPSTTIH